MFRLEIHSSGPRGVPRIIRKTSVFGPCALLIVFDAMLNAHWLIPYSASL